LESRKLLFGGITLDEVVDYNTDWIEDFNKKIPRQEVEEIGMLIGEYVERIVPDAEYTITGGCVRPDVW